MCQFFPFYFSFLRPRIFFSPPTWKKNPCRDPSPVEYNASCLIYFSVMPQVTLLRHAESMANVANTLGQEPINMYDAPLTDEGKQQASRVPNILSRCHTKRRTGARPPFFWHDTDFSKKKKKISSRCHTLRTRPSFGMICMIDNDSGHKGPFCLTQASRVSGHYDVVLCSPMRRTRETLQNSNITYDKLVRVTLSLSFYFVGSKEYFKEKSTFLSEQMGHGYRIGHQKFSQYLAI